MNARNGREVAMGRLVRGARCVVWAVSAHVVPSGVGRVCLDRLQARAATYGATLYVSPLDGGVSWYDVDGDGGAV
jgi:hypothetical protein